MGDEANSDVCLVYSSEDHFTTLVQIVLASIALAALWFKRLNEIPRRKFRVWFLDVSKQAFGACYAHVLNMVVAAMLGVAHRGEYMLDDQCAWYAIAYTVDVTFGLVLAILFLRLLDHVANERDWVSLRHSGVYDGPDALVHWTHQMLAWLVILTIVKIIVAFFMWLASPILAQLGAFLFAPLQYNIRVELVFVMIVLPGILNVIYFWITDTFLKASKEHASAHEDHQASSSSLSLAGLSSTQDSKKEALIESEEDLHHGEGGVLGGEQETLAKNSPYVFLSGGPRNKSNNDSSASSFAKPNQTIV